VRKAPAGSPFRVALAVGSAGEDFGIAFALAVWLTILQHKESAMCATMRWSILSATLLLTAPAGADQPGFDKDQLSRVQVAAMQLAFDLNNLQDELSFQKEVALYRQADLTLARVAHFQEALKFGVSRANLQKSYDDMDKQLHELTAVLQKAKRADRSLQRALDRVLSADIDLHYALAEGDQAPEQTKKVLARQAEGLVLACQELERAAHFAMSATPQENTLEAQVRKLGQAARLLQEGLGTNQSDDQLRKAFQPVNATWEQVELALRSLSPQANVYLLRSAGRVDRLLDHLHRMLKIEDKRKGLTIKT